MQHPISGMELPIIADPILVDPTMGTGALKVTPAHDPNDFSCAQRHGLPVEEILDSYGCLLPAAGAMYAAQDRFTVREKLREDLASMGLYRGREPHSLALARCSRTGDILEPRLMPQWFVECGGMAERALELVEKGDVRLWPSSHLGVWRSWLTNIQEWCVSRQLWWGHRIPAYRAVRDVPHDPLQPGARWTVPGSRGAGWVDESGVAWIVARSESEAWTVAKEIPSKSAVHELVQDEDVLDTWFSSALLPISALGWPAAACSSEHDSTKGELVGSLAKYYPLNVMETGCVSFVGWNREWSSCCSRLVVLVSCDGRAGVRSDILFFWVARMMMICLEMVERAPFEQVREFGIFTTTWLSSIAPWHE